MVALARMYRCSLVEVWDLGCERSARGNHDGYSLLVQGLVLVLEARNGSNISLDTQESRMLQGNYSFSISKTKTTTKQKKKQGTCIQAPIKAYTR
jgi:tRNA uridine 5-carbamoylmethylation protein Kti12